MKIRMIATLAASAALVLGTTGCATKRYVKATVSPVESRVGQVEKAAQQNTTDIDALEKTVSRNEELLTATTKEAKEATELAKNAGSKADAAGTRANGAYSLAEQGIAKTTAVEKTVGKMSEHLENMDNFQLLKSDSIQFLSGKTELTAAGKAKLDELAALTKDSKRFIVELQGFSDSLGSRELNLQLTDLRAQNVARYLTSKHGIPLHRIAMLGMGNAQPVATNKTKAGRFKNRRVEVKVYAAPDMKSDNVAGAPASKLVASK